MFTDRQQKIYKRISDLLLLSSSANLFEKSMLSDAKKSLDKGQGFRNVITRMMQEIIRFEDYDATLTPNVKKLLDDLIEIYGQPEPLKKDWKEKDPDFVWNGSGWSQRKKSMLTDRQQKFYNQISLISQDSTISKKEKILFSQSKRKIDEGHDFKETVNNLLYVLNQTQKEQSLSVNAEKLFTTLKDVYGEGRLVVQSAIEKEDNTKDWQTADPDFIFSTSGGAFASGWVRRVQDDDKPYSGMKIFSIYTLQFLKFFTFMCILGVGLFCVQLSEALKINLKTFFIIYISCVVIFVLILIVSGQLRREGKTKK
ncbi:MAG: hypothetical protein FWE43_04600 [Streptococcaceae bacterium]|nr:hypothetical protein [Streptococcaceae bacterium]MCL2681750.1 hypothetical protein [Streptococcaceae bacterium]